jgi:hypothetical protein
MGFLAFVFSAALLAGFLSGCGQRRPGEKEVARPIGRATQTQSWENHVTGKKKEARSEKSSSIGKREHRRQTVFLEEGGAIRGVILNKGKSVRTCEGRRIRHYRVILRQAGGDSLELWGEDLQRALIGFDLGDEVEIECLGNQPVEIDGKVTLKKLYRARKV